MALEIERRFLVNGSGWRPLVRWRRHLRQGYLLEAATALTLRVRLEQGPPPEGNDQPEAAWLTLKARPPAAPDGEPPATGLGPDGLVRLEYEVPIPIGDGEGLLALCGPRRLEKWRHGLELGGGDWVLDVFEGANAPLVVAEVELERADSPVAIPSWCGPELTGRHDLSNAALACRPLAAWEPAARQELLAGLAPPDAAA